MGTRGKIVLIITTILVGVPAATSASAAEPDDIVNYRGYSDRLASSGQPTRSQFPGLKEAGVLELFTPGASTEQILEWVAANVHPRAR